MQKIRNLDSLLNGTERMKKKTTTTINNNGI